MRNLWMRHARARNNHPTMQHCSACGAGRIGYVVTALERNGTKRFWDVLHPRKPEIDLPDQLAYWRAHLQPQLGPMTDAFMPFANGAVASASGALLAARPKAFYEQLRRTVSTGDTPDAIIYLELAWAYIMGHAELAHACSRQIANNVEVGGTAAARKLV